MSLSDVSQRREAILFVLSGPSGAGKDSLIQELRRRLSDMHFPVTATTRRPRPGEVQGLSYHFIDLDTYNLMLAESALIAPAEVHGSWYGAPVEEIEPVLEKGVDVFLKIDVQGAQQVRSSHADAVFIFLAPSSMEMLRERLRRRQTESETEFELRVKNANKEAQFGQDYDYWVVNAEGALAHAVDDVLCIVRAERLRTKRLSIHFASN